MSVSPSGREEENDALFEFVSSPAGRGFKVRDSRSLSRVLIAISERLIHGHLLHDQDQQQLSAAYLRPFDHERATLA